MAESEGAYGLLLGGECFFGVDGYGECGGDALVAGAGVGHYGYACSGHAGVAGGGCVGEYAREYGVAHYGALALAVECASHGVAVAFGEGLLCGGFVEAARLEDEAELVEGRGHGIFPDEGEGELGGGGVGKRGRGGVGSEFVGGGVDEGGVSAGYHGCGGLAGGVYGNGDVEFVARLGAKLDGDGLGERERVGNGLGGDVAEHFEAEFGAAHGGSEGHGDGQAHASCAGDAYAHCVFEHVRRQDYVDVFGAASEHFGGAGSAEGHGGGFGAAYGWYHLAADEFGDLVAEIVVEHFNKVLRIRDE